MLEIICIVLCGWLLLFVFVYVVKMMRSIEEEGVDSQ